MFHRLQIKFTLAACAASIFMSWPAAIASADEAFGPGNAPQELLALPEVQYPPAAEIADIEGWCIVEFDISSAGIPEDPSIAECKPRKVFEDASLSAISTARYKPAMRNGVAVPVANIRLKLSFVLKDRVLDELTASDRPSVEKKILILPLAPTFRGTDAMDPSLRTAIEEALAQIGYESHSVPMDQFRATALEVQKDLGGLYDPMTGAPDKQKFGLYSVNLIGKLSTVEFGAAIIPAFELRHVDLVNGEATWDGVIRSGKLYTKRGYSRKDDRFAMAISVRISCFSPDGRLLFTRLGGLDLVFPKKNGLVFVSPDMIPSMLEDKPKLAEAVNIALAPLRPRDPNLRNVPGESVATNVGDTLPRQVGVAHQEFIHGPRALAAFADGPYHQ